MFIFIINEHNELEVKFMKKIIIFLLIMMNLTSVCAVNETPRYKIIGSSYQQEDIDEMYKVKDQLLLNYKKWVKGVDNVYQVLADHQDDFNAKCTGKNNCPAVKAELHFRQHRNCSYLL